MDGRLSEGFAPQRGSCPDEPVKTAQRGSERKGEATQPRSARPVLGPCKAPPLKDNHDREGGLDLGGDRISQQDRALISEPLPPSRPDRAEKISSVNNGSAEPSAGRVNRRPVATPNDFPDEGALKESAESDAEKSSLPGSVPGSRSDLGTDLGVSQPRLSIYAYLLKPPPLGGIVSDWQPWPESIVPAWVKPIEKCGKNGRELVAVLTLNPRGRAELTMRFDERGGVMCVAGTVRGQGIRDPARAKLWAGAAITEWLTDRVNSEVVKAVRATTGKAPVDGFFVSTIHDIYYMMLLLCH